MNRPGLGGRHRGRGRCDPEERASRFRSALAAQLDGDRQARMEGRHGHHARRLKEAYLQILERGLGQHLSPTNMAARACRTSSRHHRGDVGRGESRLQALPDADPGRDRAISHVGPDAVREKFLPTCVSASGPHHEPHRAAGGQRSSLVRTKATAATDGTYRSRARRFHHLRRARLHREHRALCSRASTARRGREGISLFAGPSSTEGRRLAGPSATT